MGNIVNDIVEDINIKPNKIKLVLKWIISITGSLIVLAFTFGQFKSSFFNRMDKFEETLTENATSITNLDTKMNIDFKNIDIRIDKIYTDGLLIFNNFQDYNNAQLGLIIDYSNDNKNMLKRMLEISAIKQQQEIKTHVEIAKNELIKYQSEISVQKINEQPITKDYYEKVFFIGIEINDTTFYLTGATKRYIDNIDSNKYNVGAKTENPKYPGRYNVAYRNKR